MVPVLEAVRSTASYELSHEYDPTVEPFGWWTTRSRSARKTSDLPRFDVPEVWLLHASATRTRWPFTTEMLRVTTWPAVIVPNVQLPYGPLSRIRFDQRADAVPTPSWSRLRPPPGRGVRRFAPAMRIARAASGQVARVAERAKSWAPMPATIGLAMLVPSPIVPFAVRTLTAGADRFGLLKSPCEFHAVPPGSR